ncbi:MAG: hydrogenase subunit MbhD domain-containing protein [Allosphingosinicella sp.]|uniref:hydrogenase subunit MbhD domain-containing protein n=1 Tax=Allosphingosinicella sp. TaxID=2823234 RepID=UPI0039391AB5
MNVGEAFDILLCLIIVAVALGAIAGRDLFAGVALFVVYGLLLAIAWVRLGAVDVALAEAAIGAGLTGVLLLGAAARLEGKSPHRLDFRPAALILCVALAAGLAVVVVDLVRPDVGLRPQVAANLAVSGADNPVTAVLLNFRGWDTLLEAVVLLIALVGVWALAPDDLWGGRPGLRQHVRPDGVLATFGRFLPPVGLVIGVYLVWTGASAPGGAFQGGTVLAAVWLLAMMAGLDEPPRVSSAGLRWALVLGPAVFVMAGLYGIAHGAFLSYPPGAAKELILAIEFALTLSIAVTLALLVMGPPRRAR